MRKDSGFRARLIPAAAAVGLVLALGGCSATPDWANPVEWYKGVEGWFEDDDEAARARERARRPEMQAPGADQPFPTLSTVPERPNSATMEQRRRVEQGLVADRERARHAELGPGDAPRSSGSPPGAPPPPRVVAPPEARGSAGPSPGVSEGSAGSANDAFQSALAEQREAETRAPAYAQRNSAPPVRRNTMPVPDGSRGRVALTPPQGSMAAGDGSLRIGMAPNPAPGPIGPSSGSRQVGIVYFENASSHISENYHNALRNIIKMQRERGGHLRVVGHASSRTRNVPPLRHQLANFRISMDRARAVARLLVRYGAPAERVSVSAVADNHPVYYEVMPRGEAGNRRAEIYLDY